MLAQNSFDHALECLRILPVQVDDNPKLVMIWNLVRVLSCTWPEGLDPVGLKAQ